MYVYVNLTWKKKDLCSGIILKLAGDGCSAERLSILLECSEPRWMFVSWSTGPSVQRWVELELVRQVGRGKVQQTFVHLSELCRVSWSAKLVSEGWAARTWRFSTHSIVLYSFNSHADGRVAWMPDHWAIVRVLHGRKALERLIVESAANDLRHTCAVPN